MKSKRHRNTPAVSGCLPAMFYSSKAMPFEAIRSLIKAKYLTPSDKTRILKGQIMPEAFILFKTEPSHEREVYLSLTSHQAVKEVHALYGEFDLLARISSDSAQNLTTLLMKEFRTIEGIRDTQTLIAVEY